ncbi:MAG TPA: S8 family peptidase [Solirubrobacteraceae bacterium]|nr:S8 family peptidase [Solirubrobacteraceae bacterium]
MPAALAAGAIALPGVAGARADGALADAAAAPGSTNVLASPFVADDMPTPYREGVVILGFHPHVSLTRERAIERSVRATAVEQLGPTLQPVREHGVLRVAPTPLLLYVPGQNVLAISSSLAAQQTVAYAEPDYLLSASATPNDPFFEKQWGDSNTGQSIPTQTGNEEEKLGPPVSGTPGADDRAAKAWNVTTGSSSVVIGEADTGIQYTHPDLSANVWTNTAKIGGCANATHGYNVLTKTCEPMDDDTVYGGHGTHVAGIMGAVGNNGTGVAGMNWQTSLLPVKWLNSKAGGETSGLIAALRWLVAAKQEGVNIRVVNDSATFRGTSFSQALSEEIDTLGANNILFVTAAGNTHEDNDLEASRRYPCDYDRPSELCVTATNNTDHLAPWANWGPNTVQLAAPGEAIYSTLREGKYGYLSGGSMAAAQVSGAAALILSTQPALSATQLRADILESVDKLSSLEGEVITGGRLDVCKAIPGCLPPVGTGPPKIEGETRQEKTLKETHGEWTNSPTAYTIEWQRCESSGLGCSTISSAANKQEYVLEAADVGKKIKVIEGAENAGGKSEKTQESALAGPVLQAVPQPGKSPPKIEGETRQEKTLKETHGEWTNSPTAYTIEWQRCESSGSGCSTISSAANKQEYVLEAADVGKKIKVLETASNAGGSAEKAAESALTGVVEQAVPVNASPPKIEGEAHQETQLTEHNGVWTNSPTEFSYQWLRCNAEGTLASCKAIEGATKPTYVVQGGDVGHALRVQETAGNAGGSGASATSEATHAVTPSYATFGKSTVGASTSRIVANRKTVTRYQLARAGTVVKLSVYLHPARKSGRQLLTGVIYADGENAPRTLLASSETLAFSASQPTGWYDLVFAAPPSLPAGAYWIGILAGTASKVADYRYDPVAGAGEFNTNAFTSGASNPFGRPRADSVQLSIFATYTHE